MTTTPASDRPDQSDAGSSEPDAPDAPDSPATADSPDTADATAVDESEIERSIDDVERLKGHSRSFDDAAGINPDRTQQSRRPEED
jgi:hypothetical protein